MLEFTITKENFDAEVMNSDKPVLLDFWAPWCSPCRLLAPVISEVAKEHKDSLKVGRINVDEEPDLTEAFSVSSIPTVVLMKKGKVSYMAAGFHTQKQIEELL